jgi:hypothetical protein
MSILPLTEALVEAHDREMTTDLLLRPASYDHRPWDRLLARVRAPSLDRQLVAGRPPGSSPALAIRARQIITPAGRRELARRWEHVLDLAGRPPVPRTPRGPLHNRRSPLDLGAEVRQATRQMDPFAGALTDGADRDSAGWHR